MPEKIVVEIPLYEYRELVKSEHIANILLSLIHDKTKKFRGLTHDEVVMLDEMYNRQNPES